MTSPKPTRPPAEVGTDAAQEAATAGAPPQTHKPIVTHYVCPPIPWRTADWCAYFEGEEEIGGYGWGATEQEAIDDLMEMENG